MKISSSTISFYNSSGIKLFGKIFTPKDSISITSVIIIPGFTHLGTNRYKELQKYLAHRSISSFSFDYQGIGKSGGTTNAANILNLIEDTISAFSEFCNKVENKAFIIIGYSLGAYIVPKLQKYFNKAKGIVLVSPPAYSNNIENLLLNESSTKLIRSKSKDKNSEIFKKLKECKNKTLIIFGDSDKEIPLKIQTVFKNVKNKNLDYLIIPRGVHSLLRDRTPNEKLASNLLIEKIYEFIKTVSTPEVKTENYFTK